MKNYFYCNEISEHIKNILDENLSQECAKNISTGDFGIIPEPERLNEYLPAIIINNIGVAINDVNGALDIVKMEHVFEVYYLFPYTFLEMEDVHVKAKKNIINIANILMNFRGLDGFGIESEDGQAGGFIEESNVDNISFDNAETELFRMIDVPMFVGKINYRVIFRTYQRR